MEPSEEVSAVQYRELFDEALASIEERGKTPIVAGGSTLYLAAALDEMQFAPTDPEVRAALEARPQKLASLQCMRCSSQKMQLRQQRFRPAT